MNTTNARNTLINPVDASSNALEKRTQAVLDRLSYFPQLTPVKLL